MTFNVGDKVRVVGGSTYSGYEGRVNKLPGPDNKLAWYEVGTDIKPSSTGCLVFPNDQLVHVRKT